MGGGEETLVPGRNTRAAPSLSFPCSSTPSRCLSPVLGIQEWGELSPSRREPSCSVLSKESLCGQQALSCHLSYREVSPGWAQRWGASRTSAAQAPMWGGTQWWSLPGDPE